MSGKIVIIGGCAGAKVAYDIFEQQGVECCFFENYTEDWTGIKACVLTAEEFDAHMRDIKNGWFVATGDNQAREEMVSGARDSAAYLANAIHSSAWLSRYARVGKGNLLCALSYVGVGTVLGDGIILNTGASIDHDCGVANFAQIGPGARICGYVGVGPGAFIGAGATVLPHINIAMNAVVAAGAVVTKNVEAGSKVAGVPAKVLA
jgi:sugar O-acyltransferase (sialic acid O-acetyltransferase NeuD family)